MFVSKTELVFVALLLSFLFPMLQLEPDDDADDARMTKTRVVSVAVIALSLYIGIVYKLLTLFYTTPLPY